MIRSVIAVTRPRFLLLVPACVILGVATAILEGNPISGLRITMVFIGALAAHMSVNALNEFEDFRSGLDDRTSRTPFSGGTGTLQAHPEAANATKITGLGTLGVALGVGVYVSITAGWMVWIPAIVGVLIIIFYTGLINKQPVLCLVAPGIGFGACIVIGTHYALTGHFTWTSLVASMIPFFLTSNLLLLNQYPDVEADQMVGRRHLPITIGRQASTRVFFYFLASAYAVIVIAVMIGMFPRGALAGLLTVVPAIPMQAGISRFADNMPELQRFMGMNVMITLLTPILTAVGILLTY